MEHHLPPRLLAAEKLIPFGVGVADVGTDHGLLPIRLWEREKNHPIAAADLRPGPLSRAVENAEKAGCSHEIGFYLSDGLDAVPDAGIGCVSICGMGGETIREILSRPGWLKSRPMTLVLQPQTKLREVCLWLSENGWRLTGGSICEDAGRLYPVLRAENDGGEAWDERTLDRMYFLQREPLLSRWLRERREKLCRALDGIRKGSNPQSGKAAESELAWVEALEKETETWER